MNDAANVLIVLMGSLGDVVRGLSVADALKRQKPGVFITWLVEPKCAGIVSLSESVDDVVTFDRKSPIRGLLRLRRDLSRRRHDIALDLQRHFKSGLFSFLSGASRRIGFHRKNAKEFNGIFQTETIDYAPEETNKFRLYQRFLFRLGLREAESAVLSLRMKEDSPRHARKYAFVVMGSSWQSKNWVLEGYQKLVTDLLAQDLDVMLVGSKDDSMIAEALDSHFKDARVINRCGRTSLEELLAVVRYAAVGVGPDSGPGHLASAAGVPYVSLFGPTSPKRVSPAGSEHLVVTAGVGCSPCYRRECPGLDRLCMRLLSVPKVTEKVRLAIGKDVNG